jgi:hypothetical protein
VLFDAPSFFCPYQSATFPLLEIAMSSKYSYLAAACAALVTTSSFLRAELIGHWTFDEITGGITTDSGGAIDANWQNGSSTNLNWTTGQIGGAADLGGQTSGDNFFSTGNLTTLSNANALTIAVWVNPDGFTGSSYEGIFMTRSSLTGSAAGNQNWGIAWEDGNGTNPNPHLDSRTGNGIDSNPASILANDGWCHVALVWDGSAGTHVQYINGVQSASTSGPTGTISGGTWHIGHDDCCGGSRDFNGQIDDLGVWDHALSAAEIAAIYNQGLNGLALDETPLLPPTEPLNVGLVINEIHYDSEPKTEFVEFIELLNTNSTPLDISGCTFSDGINFTFPANTILAATEYLVITENPDELAAKFAIPPGTQIFQYSGSLSNDGEQIDLRNASGQLLDAIDYQAEFPWPISPNGEGDSMQLINATLDNDLGGAWRGELPTPGLANANFNTNAPPLIRQVNHLPEQPLSSEATTISAKITDPDGIASVSLLYQIVAPGDFIPAFLPNPYNTLTRNPDAPLQANPVFEDLANWITLPMVPAGGDDLFTATIPAQPHRTLVRYRIVAEDTSGASIRVPYAKDPSLNFAYFVYDGVPDYVTGDTVHSASTLTSLPVYQMITRDDDRAYAYAYETTGDNFRIPKGNNARKTYNWECALVYDGIVYDHVAWRLRQNNDRYTGNGKRSMRFRMNRGHYFQARGENGEKLAIKWRRFNTSKMARFGGTNSYGFHETINSRLWRMVGVECPYFLPAHWRMIDDADEAPDQYGGDFFGMTTIVQDIDGRLLDERDLPNGNMYKLKDGVSNPLELQRNQTRTAVNDGSDFLNIRNNLDSSQSDTWLNDHVNWDQWTRYHAVVEAVRHYDFGTPHTHFKNRAWYFQEQAGTPNGLLRIVPHDHDASWSRGYHDSLNNVGNSIGTGFPWAAIFDDIRRPPTGSEKPGFTRDYRNFIREFRQLLWQEETVNTMIDDHATTLQQFSLADRDRWVGAPAAAGRETMVPIESIAAPMKNIAFVSDTMYGENLIGGRGAFLDQIAIDAAIPDQPTISYSGADGFPAGALKFTSSSFSDPQGTGSFGAMQWRIAEVANLGDAEDTTILPAGAVWSYLDDGSDQGTAWRETDFNDFSWSSGQLPAGYGGISGTTLVTAINFGPDSNNKYPTTYFRTTTDVTDLESIGQFVFSLNVDDGAVVYVNGIEVLRDGIDSNSPVSFNTLADDNGNEGTYDSFTVSKTHFIEGTNTIAVEVHQRAGNSSDMGFDMEITASGSIPEREFEWTADWESGTATSFQETITPPAVATRVNQTYRARVRHQDSSGHWSLWSDPLEFTTTEPDLTTFTRSLVINEIMYHPAAPSAAEIAAGFDDDDFFEYIEVRNVGNQTVDLSNVRFTKGIDIDLSGTIAPGAYVLVANNLAAFEFRYGTGLPVIGEWSGKLSNAGEQLKLSFGAGETIQDFVYDDLAPWPTAPDGAGSSLVLINPFGLPNHTNPYSWRPGPATPNSTDGTTYTAAGDLLDYATKGTPVLTVLPDGNLGFSVALNQLAEDLIYEVQTSTNLENWQPQPAFILSDLQDSGTPGYPLATFTTTSPLPGERHFLRLHVQTR